MSTAAGGELQKCPNEVWAGNLKSQPGVASQEVYLLSILNIYVFIVNIYVFIVNIYVFIVKIYVQINLAKRVQQFRCGSFHSLTFE